MQSASLTLYVTSRSNSNSLTAAVYPVLRSWDAAAAMWNLAINAAGQTNTYQVTYDTRTGQIAVWRAGGYLASWTNTTPLTTGGYLSLRTDGANVLFDDLVVSEVVKYYEAGGQRVAVRKNGALSYLFGDHLGSTSVTANSSGTRTGELWYKPWGEYRGTAYGTTPTTYRFTGQREDASIGLYFYGARYYDSALGRFAQADSIVPQPGNPQALNRYAYVTNNPLKYTDPTGHWPGWLDFLFGAGYQFVNDMTFGMPNAFLGTDWQEEQSAAFQQGQELGRTESTVMATALTVEGTFKAGAGLAGLAAGATCTVGTAGACAAVAAPAGVIEGGLIIEGAAEAAYGGGVLAYASGHPTAGPRYTARNFRKNLENRTPLP